MSKEEKEDMPTAALRNDIRKIERANHRTRRSTESRGPPSRPADACPCAIIRSENFSLYYGAKAGVKNITMDIYPCSVTAIIGPSGCGKSTFLRSINRMNDLIPHVRTEGRLLVDGHDVYDKRTNLVNLRQQVGMVFQKPNPFPKSIFDNVAYGPRLQGVRNRGELQNVGRAEPAGGGPVGGSQGRPARNPPWPFPAASSSGSASPGPWPPSPGSC